MTSTAVPERIGIPGPAGTLQAVVEDVAAPGPRFAIVCHPHPLYGGTMDNKVVTTLGRALRTAGMPTVRFNFRGVGTSAGAFDGGRGETQDAEAVLAWGGARWPGRRCVLAGFSFGSYVALRASRNSGIAWLITVAPPVQTFDFAVLPPPECPWLVIQGDADDVVDAGRVRDWVHSLRPAPDWLLLPGTGHFFHGRLNELHDAVTSAAGGLRA